MEEAVSVLETVEGTQDFFVLRAEETGLFPRPEGPERRGQCKQPLHGCSVNTVVQKTVVKTTVVQMTVVQTTVVQMTVVQTKVVKTKVVQTTVVQVTVVKTTVKVPEGCKGS